MDAPEATTDSVSGSGIVAGDDATPRDIARDVIMQLGVGQVAAWCGVPSNTVYVWLKRGSDVEPIPLLRAIEIFRHASAAGLPIDIRSLAPAIPAEVVA